MIVLLLFAFISGLLTILAPCIWPLLPLVLSTSASHPSRRRPLGITLGVVASFTIFTLTMSSLVRVFHVNPDWFRLFSVAVLLFIGVSLLIPNVNSWAEYHIFRAFRYWSHTRAEWDDGFWGGVLAGISLGAIWSPFAGPILASITDMAAAGNVDSEVFATTIAYVAGIGIPLFGLAYWGHRIVFSSTGTSRLGRRLQIFFGVTTILTALLIFGNYDTLIEARLLKTFPQYAALVNNFENNPRVQKELQNLEK